MSNNKGFTLLEVMIALLVVAVALGGVIKVMGSAAANSSRLTGKTFAQWVALNQMTKLQINHEWPKLGDANGSDEMAGQKWKWVQKTIKTEDKNIKRIEVSVWNINEDNSDPFVTVVGFLANPGAIK
jgi:general secretion pathway protein I